MNFMFYYFIKSIQCYYMCYKCIYCNYVKYLSIPLLIITDTVTIESPASGEWKWEESFLTESCKPLPFEAIPFKGVTGLSVVTVRVYCDEE